ncbi:MAG: 50S ribosomal protein L13 [Armatimonadetes bacterium]|jgi:large subunit ribosomal protein L13|nr:50S ribosomal protein L13 [Armatimonadota bacterium]
MGTYFAKREDITRKWFVVDAAGMPIGRLAVEVAKILRGKHKPTFTPHVDCGDHVIVVNAEKCVLVGANKADEPVYRHSGYPGGLKSVTRGEVLARTPEKAIYRAVKGMLPHNKLGDAMISKLKVHVGPEHSHQAQKPEELKIA